MVNESCSNQLVQSHTWGGDKREVTYSFVTSPTQAYYIDNDARYFYYYTSGIIGNPAVNFHQKFGDHLQTISNIDELDGLAQSEIEKLLTTANVNDHARVFITDILKNISFKNEEGKGSSDVIIFEADLKDTVIENDTYKVYGAARPNTENIEYRGFDGDIWFDYTLFNTSNYLQYGTEEGSVLFHELAHMVGLDHPIANSDIDSHKYTIMSNKPHDELYFAEGKKLYAYGLQLMDIAALETMYGTENLNYEVRAKDTTYEFGFGLGRDGDISNAFMYTIWDGGGDNDKLDAFAFNTFGALLDLRQGHFSSIGEDGNNQAAFIKDGPDTDDKPDKSVDNVAIAYGTEIEDARGTIHDDLIHGNEKSNILEGELGVDVVYGYENDDVFVATTDYETNSGLQGDKYDGGNGDETYGDALTYSEISHGVAIDLNLQKAKAVNTDGLSLSGNTYGEFDTFLNIERFVTTKHNDIVKTSGAGNDWIDARGGNDYILGSAGTDTIYGGDGIDTVDYSNVSGGISVVFIDNVTAEVEKLATGQIDTLKNIEVIKGTSGQDYFDIRKADKIITVEGGDGGDIYTVYSFGSGVTLSRAIIKESSTGTGDDIIKAEDYTPNDTNGEERGQKISVKPINFFGTVIDILPGIEYVDTSSSSAGPSSSTTTLYAREEYLDEEEEEAEEQDNGPADDINDQPNSSLDPLVLDLDGDGVTLTTTGQGVYYSLAGDDDGFLYATTWVSNADGILIYDVNDNDNVDSESEWFGDATTDGFTALAAYDSNTDGVINSSDTIWSDLKLWIDANSNGKSDSGELVSLSTYLVGGENITSISLSHSGNIGSFSYGTSSSAQAQSVIFTQDKTNSLYVGNTEINALAHTLPNLRGFGKIADLSYVASADSDMLDAMLDFNETYSDIESIFANYETAKAAFTDIMFYWGGVYDVAPDSRGGYLQDARKFEFIEKLLNGGVVYDSYVYANGDEPNSTPAYTGLLAFEYHLEKSFTNYIVQSMAESLFDSQPSYSVRKGNFSFAGGSASLNTDILADLGDLGATLSDANAKIEFWANIVDTILKAQELDLTELNTNAALQSELDTAIALSDSSLDWSDIYSALDARTLDVHYIDGDGNQTDSGNPFAGRDGDDLLEGRGGADNIYGGAGDDVLIGGTGVDGLYGQNGNDTYIFDVAHGFGNGTDSFDSIDEASFNGHDTIKFTGGYNMSNVRWTYDGTYLEFYSSLDNGKIIVEGDIEAIEFENGPVFDLTNGIVINDLDTFHDQGVDGTTGADILYGNGGFDYITAGAGDDFIDSGAGTDEIDGEDGIDTISYSTLTTAVTVDLVQGLVNEDSTGAIEDTLYNIENVITGSGDDIIIMDDSVDNVIDGGEGFDTVNYSAYSAAVTINLATGEVDDDGDSVYEDTLISIENIVSGSGNDTLLASASDNDINGGAGTDRLSYAAFTTAVTFNLASDNVDDDGDEIANDTYSNIEEFEGGSGNDVFKSDGGYSVYGGLGSDTINYENHTAAIVASLASGTVDLDGDTNTDDFLNGIENIVTGSGDDTLTGDANDNIFTSGAGVDYISGGSGSDTVSYMSFTTKITVNQYLEKAYKVIDGNGDTDTSIYDTIISIENITTGSGSDNITADSNNNIVNAGDGDNEVNLGYGDDTLATGSGVDYILTGDGADVVYAGAGNDNINYDKDTGASYTSWWGLKHIYGEAGDDYIRGGTAITYLYGGSDNDNIHGGASLAFVEGNSGSDTIYTSTQNDEIWGADFEDFGANLSEFEFEDTETGYFYHYFNYNSAVEYDSTDLIDSYHGNNIIYAGNNVRLTAATTTFGGETFTDHYFGNIIFAGDNNDTIYGGSGDDYINTGSGVDIIYAGDGDDVINKLSTQHTGQKRIYGGNGNDEIHAGQSGDILFGGNGNDVFYGYQYWNTYFGEYGDDIFHAGQWGDAMHGGHGNDVGVAYGITWDSSTQTATYSGNENDLLQDNTGLTDVFYGYEGDDTFFAGGGNDVIYGGSYGNPSNSGSDTLYGDDGNDEIHGDDGNDYLYSGNGEDTIFGGDGDDFINSAALSATDTGHKYLYGNDGNDTIYGATEDDQIFGGDGDDIIYGGGEGDYILGGNGADIIYGEAGADAIYGNEDNDHIYGGAGANNIFGGTGADIFYFLDGETATGTTLYDFTTSDGDKINIVDVIEFDSGTDVITDFVKVTASGSNSHIEVSVFGDNTWVDLATVSGTDLINDYNANNANAINAAFIY